MNVQLKYPSTQTCMENRKVIPEVEVAYHARVRKQQELAEKIIAEKKAAGIEITPKELVKVAEEIRGK